MDFFKKLLGAAKKWAGELLTGKLPQEKIRSPIPSYALKEEELRYKYLNADDIEEDEERKRRISEIRRMENSVRLQLSNKMYEKYKTTQNKIISEIYKNLSDYFLKTPYISSKKEEEMTLLEKELKNYKNYYLYDLKKNVLDNLSQPLIKAASKRSAFLGNLVSYKIIEAYDSLLNKKKELSDVLFKEDEREEKLYPIDHLFIFTGKLLNSIIPPPKENEGFGEYALRLSYDTFKVIPKAVYGGLKQIVSDLGSIPYGTITAFGLFKNFYHSALASINDLFGLKKQAEFQRMLGKTSIETAKVLTEKPFFLGVSLKGIAEKTEYEPKTTSEKIGAFIGGTIPYIVTFEWLPQLFIKGGKVADVVEGVNKAGIIAKVLNSLKDSAKLGVGFALYDQFITSPQEREKQLAEALEAGKSYPLIKTKEFATDVVSFIAVDSLFKTIAKVGRSVFFGRVEKNALEKEVVKKVEKIAEDIEKSNSVLIKAKKEEILEKTANVLRKEIVEGERNISRLSYASFYKELPENMRKFIDEKLSFVLPKSTDFDAFSSIFDPSSNASISQKVRATLNLIEKLSTEKGITIINKDTVEKELTDYFKKITPLIENYFRSGIVYKSALEDYQYLVNHISGKELYMLQKRLGSKIDDILVGEGDEEILNNVRKALRNKNLFESFTYLLSSTGEKVSDLIEKIVFSDYDKIERKISLIEKRISRLKQPKIEFMPIENKIADLLNKKKVSLDLNSIENLKILNKHFGFSNIEEFTFSDFKDLGSFYTKAVLIKNQAKNKIFDNLSKLKSGESLISKEEETGEFLVSSIVKNINKIIETLNIVYPKGFKPEIINKETHLYKLAKEARDFAEFLSKAGKIEGEKVREILEKENLKNLFDYFATVSLEKAEKSAFSETKTSLFSKIFPAHFYEAVYGKGIAVQMLEKLSFINDQVPTTIKTILSKYLKEAEEIGGESFKSGEWYKLLEKLGKGEKTNASLLNKILNSSELSEEFKKFATLHISTFESLRGLINSVRKLGGRDEIGEIVGYVPHKMNSVIIDAISSFYEQMKGKSLGLAQPVKERLFRDLGIGRFFSSNPKEIISSYEKSLTTFVRRGLIKEAFEKNILGYERPPEATKFLVEKLRTIKKGERSLQQELNYVIDDFVKSFPILTKEVKFDKGIVEEMLKVAERNKDEELKFILNNLAKEPFYTDLNFLGKTVKKVLNTISDVIFLPFNLGYIVQKSLFLNPNFLILAILKKIPTGGAFKINAIESLYSYFKAVKTFGFAALGKEEEKRLLSEIYLHSSSYIRGNEYFITNLFDKLFFSHVNAFTDLVSYNKAQIFWEKVAKAQEKENREEVARLIRENLSQLSRELSTFINLTTGATYSAPSRKGDLISQAVFLYKNFLTNLLGLTYAQAKAILSDSEAKRFVDVIVSRSGLPLKEVKQAVYDYLYKGGNRWSTLSNMFSNMGLAIGMTFTLYEMLFRMEDVVYFMATGKTPNQKGREGIEKFEEKKIEKVTPVGWIHSIADLVKGGFLTTYIPNVANFYGSLGKTMLSAFTGSVEFEKNLNEFINNFDAILSPEIVKRMDDVLNAALYQKLPSRSKQPTMIDFTEKLFGIETKEPLQVQYEAKINPLYLLFGRGVLSEYQKYEKAIELQKTFQEDRSFVESAFYQRLVDESEDSVIKYNKIRKYFMDKYGFDEKYMKKLENNWLKKREEGIYKRATKTLPKSLKELLQVENKE